MQSQVAVVGGGPVGLGLTIELGRRGIRTVVIERDESIHHIPKGQNLTQRTMEHFRCWGVEDEIRAARVMPPSYPSAGVNAYGNLMSRFAHPWFRRSQVDDFYFTANERLPQYLTEAVLRRRLEELPSVTSLFGVAARTVDQDPSGAVVGTTRGQIETEYVVGCDGSHSLVREAAGIGEHRSEHDKRMVLLVFRSRQLHAILEERFGETSFFNVLHPDLEGYWRFLGRVDVGEGWFFHAPVPPDASSETIDHVELLHSTVGAEFDISLDHMGFWDLRIAVADTYRLGRVLIAGDAAHSHPPYGGYGVNTGLEDARNLGWKLAAVLDGWAGDSLLASYTEERLPVFESTAREFIEAFIENDRRFIEANDPTRDEKEFAAAWERRRTRSNRGVSDFEPHYEGSPIVHGPEGGTSSAVGMHSFRAVAGHHLPARRLSDGGELFDALGDGFTLITSSTETGESFRAAANAGGVPLSVVVDSFEGEMSDYGSEPILVRPDHFVSWVDDGAPYDPKDILAASIGS